MGLDNRNETETQTKVIGCIKSFEGFWHMSQAKPNAKSRTNTELDFIFSVSVAEYSKYAYM